MKTAKIEEDDLQVIFAKNGFLNRDIMLQEANEMSKFTTEEINLICIYDPGNRAGTIYELRNMKRYLMPDETELMNLTEGVISKLESMTDSEYQKLSDELTPACFEAFDSEDTAFGSLPFGIPDSVDPDADIE